jgi:prepilin-type N-terminal cleavage/methylation domain-containing protein
MHIQQKGFSMVELLVAMAVTLVVMGAAVGLYLKSAQINIWLSQKAEMQSEIRAGSNQLARDLDQAGTGIPIGGLPIPSAATGGTNPQFACDSAQCYITPNNKLTLGTLYKVTPANSVGPTTSEATDAIIITYIDPALQGWTAYPTSVLADDGTTLTMPAGTTPALNDPSVGLDIGDVLLLQNANGSALGVVTSFTAASGLIAFASADPLNINQPAAPVGNVKSLQTTPAPAAPNPKYPAVTVSRVMMITYFIQTVNTTDGPDTRLMRQIGARTPTPVAEHIQDLKFTYDVFDSTTGTLTSNLPDAATGTPPTPKPNQIRKINITITQRSPRRNAQGYYDATSLTTSVGPRNLSFQDRYN